MRAWLRRALGVRETAESPSPGRIPAKGDVLKGKYRVEGLLGRGGMGVVLAAHHELLDKKVAVKVLFAESGKEKDSVARFLREARAAAMMQSEHVVGVMDIDTLEDGSPFLVMERLEGCDLSELLENSGPLPCSEVADYMLQALEALAQAHARGIIHRDLKPSNLFHAMRPDGSKVVKILDFGISKSMTASSSKRTKTLTGARSLLGSPAYMSPEQLRTPRAVDARSDLWSLGVVAYELVSGTVPFDAAELSELLVAVLEKDPAPLRSFVADVPEGFDAAVLRCLKRNVADRFQDAGELATALAPFGSGAWGDVVGRTQQLLARGEELSRPRMFPRIAAGTGPRVFDVETAVAAASPANPALTSTERDLRAAELVPTASTVGHRHRTLFGASQGSRTRTVLVLGVCAGVGIAGVTVMQSQRTASQKETSAQALASAPPPVASGLPSNVPPERSPSTQPVITAPSTPEPSVPATGTAAASAAISRPSSRPRATTTKVVPPPTPLPAALTNRGN